MPSWIADYMSLIDPYSQSPQVFNMWAAMSVVSGVMKRNVWINYGTYQIYPNTFIILVAPPGVGKGEAMKPAHEFARENKLINYFNDRATAPKIVDKLAAGFSGIPKINGNGQVQIQADKSAMIYAPELHSFLSASDWMFTFLCQVWDQGEYDYSTKKDDLVTVKEMCVGLISGCVPEYITKLSKESTAVVSSGFSARTIFLKADKPSKKITWGDNFRQNPALAIPLQNLTDRMQLISGLKGEVEVLPCAKQIFDVWYNSLTVDESDSMVMKNFKSRQHVHVLKTAMILSASLATVSTTHLVINDIIMQQAISLINDVSDGLDEVFRGVGESDIAEGIARMQLYFIRKNQVSYGEILRDNIRFLNEENILRILRALEYMGFIRVVNNNGGMYYYYSGQPLTVKPFNGVTI